MRLFRLSTHVALAVGVGCLHFAQASYAVEGKVIDGSTGKPLVGVYVIGAWQTNIGLPGKSTSGCPKLEVVRTDEEGRFVLSTWSGSILAHLFGDENLNDYYYFQGYRWDRGSIGQQTSIALVPDTRSSFERLGYLSELAAKADCGSAEDQVKTAVPLYRVMYEEGKGLALDAKGRRVLSTILFRQEVVEFGYERAQNNAASRLFRGYP